MAASWAKRVEGKKGFEFTAKLYQRFTHNREEQWTAAAEADEVKRGMAPLAEAGKLGGILVQFPWSFKNEAVERKWLERLVAEFAEYPLYLEVRHDSWREEDFFKYLDEAGVGFVDIDQPVIGKSIPPMEKVTGGQGGTCDFTGETPRRGLPRMRGGGTRGMTIYMTRTNSRRGSNGYER